MKTDIVTDSNLKNAQFPNSSPASSLKFDAYRIPSHIVSDVTFLSYDHHIAPRLIIDYHKI